MSRKPRHSLSLPEPRVDEGRDRWLLSYGDFMTLLLALFVVLYASARVDAQKSHSLFEGIQSAFLFETSTPVPIPIETSSDSEAIQSEPDPLGSLAHSITGALSQQRTNLGEEHGATLGQDERGLVISLSSAEFFPAGGVEIAEERRNVLASLAPILAGHSGSLHFEGHTDDQPISSERYPSNWELSTARAAAIARLFIEDHEIDARRVVTTGYAEFRPIVSNEDEASRARNRRVEILILDDVELTPGQVRDRERAELDLLLDGLPPIPDQADDSLKPRDPGPPPEDIPLP